MGVVLVVLFTLGFVFVRREPSAAPSSALNRELTSTSAALATTTAPAPEPLTQINVQLVCLGGGDPRFPPLGSPPPTAVPTSVAPGVAPLEYDTHRHPTAVVRSPPGNRPVVPAKISTRFINEAQYGPADYQLVACVSETGRGSQPKVCEYERGNVRTWYPTRYHLSLREAHTGREVHAADWTATVDYCREAIIFEGEDGPQAGGVWDAEELRRRIAPYVN